MKKSLSLSGFNANVNPAKLTLVEHVAVVAATLFATATNPPACAKPPPLPPVLPESLISTSPAISAFVHPENAAVAGGRYALATAYWPWHCLWLWPMRTQM
jgi:hypothetical protein